MSIGSASSSPPASASLLVKRQFVLDENIVIYAKRGQNSMGQRDTSCLELIVAIERHCHGLVMGDSFWGLYSSQINHRFGGDVIEPRIMPVLRMLLVNLRKNHVFVREEDMPVIHGLDNLPDVNVGDRRFVRAAAAAPGSILVTEDWPLRRTLEVHGVPERFNFKVLTAREALPLAGPDS